MKDAAANAQATGEAGTAEQGATVEQTSLLALSRRSRRASEQKKHRESDAEMTGADAEPTGTDAEMTESDAEPTGSVEPGKRRAFRHWRRQRPFIGGVLVVLGGIELFFSGQLDTGNMQIQFGIEGLQATVVPIALAVLGLSVIFRPTHHIFYGIIALVLSVYSLIGVNLGGFILGMLLSTIGAILVVAWMGPRGPKTGASGAQAPPAERRGDSTGDEETA
ncbi:DUF6114 domain-containing protein [Brevibacterium renqingii]|uniref:DUF6114 domain-containing protein n=1 Tax=Brevibacterium renqingii TaxID=2776916 RepID=UPI0020A47EDF|nr:DUF6114 domain-containing protein [Brevibacterium renqingii]